MNAYIPVMSCVTYLSCSYSFHTNHKELIFLQVCLVS